MRACVTTSEASAVLGVSDKVIGRWVREGVIKPLFAAEGTGRNHLLNLRDLLAIAIARDLRRRGFNLAGATAACDWLQAHDLKDLQEQWSCGRRLMVVVGLDVLPRLFSRAEMVDDSNEIDLVAMHLAGVPVAIIDLAECHQRVIAKLAELRREGADSAEPAGAK